MIKKIVFTYLFLILLFIANIINAQETDDFHFVQITDTHLGIKEHNERTEKIIKSINRLPYKIEFVAHTGDIFGDNIKNYEITKEAKEIFSKLKSPIYYVPGNHDILDEEYDRTSKIYKELFTYTDTIVYVNEIKCLFMYTEPIADHKVSGAKEKLKWLNNNLKDNIPAIIFHHTPSVDDFYNNSLHDGWDKEYQEQWQVILNKYNVKAVIAGHFHRNQMHWLGNIPLYIASSVASYWGRQASYRIYTYKKGKLSYETVYIN